MKEFSYKINLGIIGPDKICNQIFLNYLDRISINSLKGDFKYEYFFVHNEIPVKTKAWVAKSYEDLIQHHDDIKKLDILICALNTCDMNSMNSFNLSKYNNFMEVFKFKGVSALIGVDLNLILEIEKNKKSYFNELSLIAKARELKLIYCFKLQDTKNELKQFYNTVLKDVILKFKILNPDLYEKAKTYALTLQKHQSLEMRKYSNSNIF
ncbi:MAG: hypothetical protein ACFFKA_03165 [Candidatus Thorarchaeota archaeon]